MKLNILLLIILLLILLIHNFCRKETLENYGNKNKLVIILPVRNREKDLEEYLENMVPIFNYQNIAYRIFVIEQSKNKRFNKGKINNIGFLEALKENKNNTKNKFILLLFIPFVCFSQEDIERYKVYNTTNIYTSLLLDSATGRIWQLQIGVGKSKRMKTVLSDRKIAQSIESMAFAWLGFKRINKETVKVQQSNNKFSTGLLGSIVRSRP